MKNSVTHTQILNMRTLKELQRTSKNFRVRNISNTHIIEATDQSIYQTTTDGRLSFETVFYDISFYFFSSFF